MKPPLNCLIFSLCLWKMIFCFSLTQPVTFLFIGNEWRARRISLRPSTFENADESLVIIGKTWWHFAPFPSPYLSCLQSWTFYIFFFFLFKKLTLCLLRVNFDGIMMFTQFTNINDMTTSFQLLYPLILFLTILISISCM